MDIHLKNVKERLRQYLSKPNSMLEIMELELHLLDYQSFLSDLIGTN